KHQAVFEYMAHPPGPIITTSAVIVELGNYLCATPGRRLFVPFVRDLKRNRRFEIVPADDALIERGLDLYGRRTDKKWSLTDCTSFVLMQSRSITDAVTGDHHFQLAG